LATEEFFQVVSEWSNFKKDLKRNWDVLITKSLKIEMTVLSANQALLKKGDFI